MSDQQGNGPADVLLVEDNPGDVRLTKEAFREAEGESRVHVATDGVGALEFLQRRGEHADAPRPDIVLLDLNLPRKSGQELLREIRADPALETIPVVVLTSSEAREDVASCYEQRANAYLTKPVDPREFIDAIGTLRSFWLSVARLPPSPGE